MGTSTGRGVDNTVAGWTTDYMLAVILAYLACRLFNRGASGASLVQYCGASPTQRNERNERKKKTERSERWEVLK